MSSQLPGLPGDYAMIKPRAAIRDGHTMTQEQAKEINNAARDVYLKTLDFPLVDLGSYRPLHDLVIVQFNQSPEKSEGGVFLPDVAQRRPEEGIVVCVGPGNVTYNGNYVPVSVKRGDRVRYNPQAFGNAVKFAGINPDIRLIELRESDVFGFWPADGKSGARAAETYKAPVTRETYQDGTRDRV